ncbi:unnamed protein product [Amoebophrya sp. A120]|nr:unnamed protein product [Amoebophrya sp. A120]|eukprot:GSA120T00019055001.1
MQGNIAKNVAPEGERAYSAQGVTAAAVDDSRRETISMQPEQDGSEGASKKRELSDVGPAALSMPSTVRTPILASEMGQTTSSTVTAGPARLSERNPETTTGSNAAPAISQEDPVGQMIGRGNLRWIAERITSGSATTVEMERIRNIGIRLISYTSDNLERARAREKALLGKRVRASVRSAGGPSIMSTSAKRASSSSHRNILGSGAASVASSAASRAAKPGVSVATAARLAAAARSFENPELKFRPDLRLTKQATEKLRQKVESSAEWLARQKEEHQARLDRRKSAKQEQQQAEVKAAKETANATKVSRGSVQIITETNRQDQLLADAQQWVEKRRETLKYASDFHPDKVQAEREAERRSKLEITDESQERFNQLFQRQKDLLAARQARIDELRKQKEDALMEACTFQPPASGLLPAYLLKMRHADDPETEAGGAHDQDVETGGASSLRGDSADSRREAARYLEHTERSKARIAHKVDSRDYEDIVYKDAHRKRNSKSSRSNRGASATSSTSKRHSRSSPDETDQDQAGTNPAAAPSQQIGQQTLQMTSERAVEKNVKNDLQDMDPTGSTTSTGQLQTGSVALEDPSGVLANGVASTTSIRRESETGNGNNGSIVLNSSSAAQKMQNSSLQQLPVESVAAAGGTAGSTTERIAAMNSVETTTSTPPTTGLRIGLESGVDRQPAGGLEAVVSSTPQQQLPQDPESSVLAADPEHERPEDLEMNPEQGDAPAAVGPEQHRPQEIPENLSS